MQMTFVHQKNPVEGNTTMTVTAKCHRALKLTHGNMDGWADLSWKCDGLLKRL